VRRGDGKVVARVGEHERFWVAPPDGRSTLDHVRVPVLADRQPWGNIEIAFASSLPDSLGGWIVHRTVLLVAAVVLCGFAAFYLYLRRALQYLDPTAAIPERVRTAFDALTEAVMVLDTKGRVMLCNARFHRLYGADQAELLGKNAAALPWAAGAWSADPAQSPWMRAMADRVTVRDEPLDITLPDRSALHTLVSSAPIEDGYGRLRGCMVTISDVTELHRANEKLRTTLRDLEASRQQIREKNKELTHLATSDPLTGCLNRRAFFAELQPLLERLRDEGTPLSCIMADIDHFKQINDRFGHAIGDQVISAVARTLGNGLRQGDLLCRYGGEEFCIILPGINLDDATGVAERLRRDIESTVGSAVPQTHDLQVTASFGVAVYREVMRDASELIKYADEGLYRAKRAGRNRTRRTVYMDNTADAEAAVD
jgi:diguanylate cyclase (GGDEF)-like protein/PAS domain S-box-containing protein